MSPQAWRSTAIFIVAFYGAAALAALAWWLL